MTLSQPVFILMLFFSIVGFATTAIFLCFLAAFYWEHISQRRKLAKEKNATRDNASNLSSVDRERIIAEALSTDAGREALAQSMVEPIRTRLEYQGFGRRILGVDELPQRAFSRYERDINSTAQVISRGRLPDQIMEGEEISTGLFTADDAMSDLQDELDKLDKMYDKQKQPLKEYKSRQRQIIVDDFMDDCYAQT